MRASKRLGQHFLEPVWVRRLLEAISPNPTDTFLEIGAGRGALTLPLAARVRDLVAVEIDRDLAADLGPRLPPNARLVNADMLHLDLRKWLTPSGIRPRVAGNLPYNVAAPILFRLLEHHRNTAPLADATLMLQREVADRLLAPTGSRHYGILAILVRAWADATPLLGLPPGAFRPPPRVHSAAVRLSFRAPLVPVQEWARFEALVRALFMQRRKIVLNALKSHAEAAGTDPGRALEETGIDPHRRPQTLEVTELKALADFLRDQKH